MKVSIIKCNSYHKIKKAVERSVDLLGGFQKYIKKGDKVLLKPNLGFRRPPDSGFITNPQFVKAVAELIIEAGGKVLIGDICAGIDNERNAFDITGLKDVAEQTGSKLIDLKKSGFIVKKIPNHHVIDRIGLAKKIFEVDYVINLPKLKTHHMTFLTGAVKNLFGCVHPELRLLLHLQFNNADFNRSLVDIYSIMKPVLKLNIMDAVDAIEGGFASMGNKKRVGMVLASEDAICLDTVSAVVTGHNPLQIPWMACISEKNSDLCNIKKIDILGEKIEDVIVKDFKKHASVQEERSLELVLNKDRCVKCSRCIKNCPVRAIENYKIDNAKCIRCFCCEEVCPENAIEFVKNKNAKKNKINNC